MSIKLVVATHGDFGSELIKSAGMLVGDTRDIISLALLPGMSFEDFANKAKTELDGIKNKDILCFVDLFGGTPSNTMTALTRAYSMQVITGLNLPMLVDAFLKVQAGETNLFNLTKDIFNNAKDTIVITNEKLKEAK
ncbi:MULTISPECIES: PTS sugar transporter subunit IIA [Lactobacillus]|uniref:PTS sugar transporter subunit IIA n=1 Tax=Lactobacillus TaxID=1578 RepID=UPI001C69C5E0|nr:MULTISPECIES: PTS sugar transporter subunit IIA [Lactobacillus]MCX8722589.1 PTS sugar transporter subunit IIA [Lactobacillus sp. B4005]QYN56342.1 PTS sugar transporter subunit IIA [Lactobacillus panisapium]